MTIYTLSGCGFCIQAMSLLDDKGVDYEEINVTREPEVAAQVRAKTGQRTFPQIFVGTEFVGGYTELAALEQSGRLDQMLF